MWIIQAQVETSETGADGTEWSGSRQVPLFYIDRRSQGALTREAAERIAREVLNPAGLIPDERIHVHVIGTNRGEIFRPSGLSGSPHTEQSGDQS
jgi:hypothetical protein